MRPTCTLSKNVHVLGENSLGQTRHHDLFSDDCADDPITIEDIFLSDHIMSRSNMQTPLTSDNDYETPYRNVDAPEYANPDGTLGFRGEAARRGINTCGDALLYAPYGKTKNGKNAAWIYWKEIVACMLKEYLFVTVKTLFIVGIASAAAGPDAVSRAIYLGAVYALSVYVGLNWGDNSPLPRHGNLGISFAELLAGRISIQFFLLYFASGLLGALSASPILERTGLSAIPTIGAPNATSIGGAFSIEFLVGFLIIYTVLDQFSVRDGGSRSHGMNANIGDDKESVRARPAVYGAVVFVAVSFAFLKWGIFTGSDCYTYFAGALGQHWLGVANPFNQAAAATPVSGAWALFMFTTCVSAIAAWGLDWLMYHLHTNGARSSSANYGSKRVNGRARGRSPKNDVPAQRSHFRNTASSPPAAGGGAGLTSAGW